MTELVSCQRKPDGLHCVANRGYAVDFDGQGLFRLTISTALEDHEGLYSCHIKGLKDVRYQNCSFVLLKDNEPTKTEQGRSSAVNSSCTIESVKEMEPASLTCKFSTDVNMSKTHFKVVHLNGQNNTGKS